MFWGYCPRPPGAVAQYIIFVPYYLSKFQNHLAPGTYAPVIIPFGPKSFQGPQHSCIYTLPTCPDMWEEERSWTEQREQILNTALLNPSAGDQMEEPDQVGKDLGDSGHQIARGRGYEEGKAGEAVAQPQALGWSGREGQLRLGGQGPQGSYHLDPERGVGFGRAECCGGGRGGGGEGEGGGGRGVP